MRIGIFGGTFDPIHNAHLFVAESARVMEQLERVLFVPTNNTHYRSAAHAGTDDRCSMIEGAIESNAAFALDRTDLRKDASGLTADLLPLLRQAYPGAEFTFIIGADSLVNGNWQRLDDVLTQLSAFVVAPRAGVSEAGFARIVSAIAPAVRSRVKTLNLPEIPESATLIRKLIADGKSIRYLVPEPVWRYILQNNLYGMHDGVA